MLQDIRKNAQGTVAKVIVGLIVIAFAGFGVESILLGGGGSGVAEVNGESISPYDMQLAMNNQRRQLIAMMGENVDPSLLSDDRLNAMALESLIGRKLQMQSAESMNLQISSAQLGSVVGGMEQFQVDGRFSPDVYKSVISSAGYTPSSFRQGLAEDMVLMQVRSGLVGAEFATPAELALNARITGEQRDLRYLSIPVEKFRQSLEVAEAEIEAYYTENESRFLSEETVEVDYVQLSAEDFRTPVEEELILAEYELEKQNFQYRTENRVSHILFEEGDEQAQRLAQAREAIAAGEDFGAVAGQFSDDIGSSALGGDLGFTSGDAFPEEMEEAIAALEPGTVSEPVETDAGIHLILVTERREGEAPPLEQLRPELEDRIQLSAARTELLRVVEQLKDLAFNAENLQGPAAELGLEVSRSAGLTRNSGEGVFESPILRDAAFSEEVLEQGHNSDALELGDGSFVALRVTEHRPASIRPLADVREQIVAAITEERARQATRSAAEQALAALRGGSGVEEYANSAGYEWQVELGADRDNTVVPAAVLERAFELPAPAAGETTVEYVVSPAGDVEVFELVRVTEGELVAARRAALQNQLKGEYGSLVLEEYQRRLRDEADITVL